MIEVPLTHGKVALIDDEDAERVLPYKWHAVQCKSGNWYARHTKYLGNQRYERTPMHRLILNAPAGMDVDHKNGNGLDNRRENLRLATDRQNALNQRRRSDNTSGYKGVIRSGKRWLAQIHVGDKNILLGRFHEPEDAARAYDAAAREHFQDFARLNFPEDERTKAPRYNVGRIYPAKASSGFLGVTKSGQQWRAYINMPKSRQQIHLGCFRNAEDAARAYDAAAALLLGEFAQFNFPEESELIRRVLARVQDAMAA